MIGRTLRVLPTLLRVGLAETVAYRAEFVGWILAYTMPLIMLALWTAVARDAPVGAWDVPRFSAYFLVMLVVRVVTSSWVVWEIHSDVREGRLAMRLLRPLHPLVHYLAESAAALPFRVALTLPVLVGAVAWLGPSAFAHDPVELALAPVAVAGGWVLTFLVTACIGAVALHWESALGLMSVWHALYWIFSGYVVPLALFPPRFARVAEALPFRAMLAFPVECALGSLGRAGALRGLALQWIWIVVWALVLRAAWRRGMRKFSAVGG